MPRSAGEEDRLRTRRVGGPRRAGDVGRHCGDDGRPGEPRIGVCDAARGLDLTGHVTQPLTEPLVRHADVIFAMTQSHREAILAQWPTAGPRVKLLAADSSDIIDPIGGPVERYEQCALKLREEISRRLEDLDI